MGRRRITLSALNYAPEALGVTLRSGALSRTCTGAKQYRHGPRVLRRCCARLANDSLGLRRPAADGHGRQHRPSA
jgi:hypothetical protein